MSDEELLARHRELDYLRRERERTSATIDRMWKDHQCQRPDLEAIVRDLAGTLVPMDRDDMLPFDTCGLCGVELSVDTREQTEAHDPACPWRRAVEWVRSEP